jgi:hypothetical protein
MKMGLVTCSETSVRNYHYTLRHSPEERNSRIEPNYISRSSSYRAVNTLPAPYTNQAFNIAYFKPLFYVIKHSRRQNAVKSFRVESPASSDYLVNEGIDIRSRSNSTNREKFFSLHLAWQTIAKLLKQRKQAPKEVQFQVQKLFTKYNIGIGSPPVTRHDRVLLYAFRTAWVLCQ